MFRQKRSEPMLTPLFLLSPHLSLTDRYQLTFPVRVGSRKGRFQSKNSLSWLITANRSTSLATSCSRFPTSSICFRSNPLVGSSKNNKRLPEAMHCRSRLAAFRHRTKIVDVFAVNALVPTKSRLVQNVPVWQLLPTILFRQIQKKLQVHILHNQKTFSQ